MAALVRKFVFADLQINVLSVFYLTFRPHASGLIETKESDLGFQFSHEYATVLHAHRYHI
jgi:hypothetical protein